MTEPSLTEQQIETAVKRYFLKGITFLGIGNVTILGAAIAFMFVTVPERVQQVLETRIDTTNLARRVGQVEQTIEDVSEDANRWATDIRQLEDILKVSQRDIDNTSEFINLLRQNRDLMESITQVAGYSITLADPRPINCANAGRPQEQTCDCPDGQVLVGVRYVDDDPRGGGDADRIVGIQCREFQLGPRSAVVE